ncbi:MAG: peptide ABC transporter ATP-binding protein [Thermoprotei archaeon]|nr:MAG: peptide ABC transporter ATP-binding protein [Thermoprotei archaeon]
MSSVSVVNLHKSYGDLEVLKGLSLHVRSGERVVIIGPSGSGKSTLLKCIIGLVKPDRGDIYIDDVRVTDPKTNLIEVRKRVGFVFQSNNLFYHLTVLKNITLPLVKVHGVPEEEAVEVAMKVLREVGLEDKVDSYPAELSGGQQQRVAIARALAINPRLLLMDEPTSALDPELIDEVLEVMRRVSRRGITMIIVTHEIDFAEDVADRVVFIDGGVVVEEGPPHEVISSPRERRTREFLRRILRKRAAAPRCWAVAPD